MSSSTRSWSADLLDFARELQLVSDQEGLLEVAHDYVCRFTRYRSSWFYLVGHDESIELLGAFGPIGEAVRQHYPDIQIKGDAYLEEVLRSHHPVVVDDALTDPRVNRQIVSSLGNRTIINIPLLVNEDHLGAFGTGTFRPEEALPPTPKELDFLSLMASQLSMAMSRLRADLKRREAERQLQQARRIEEMGQLAGGIAHDFSNLLGAVVGYLTLAGEDIEAGHVAQKSIEQALKVTERGARLTRQLLSFSGNQLTPAGPVSPHSVIRAMATMFERLLPSDIELELCLDDTGQVVAEASQLEQIVMNLVLNARDAISADGRIVLSCSPTFADEEQVRGLGVEPGDYVRIDVNDTGSGIDEKTRAQLFEPFFSTKARERGTGLGLAVVQTIVRQYKGFVEVKSELGKGSTFSVYWPQSRDLIDESPSETPSTLRAETRATIMVVDDDVDLLDVLTLALTRAGYHVMAASNGQEALSLLKGGEAPDLVLTDVVMPTLDGVRLAGELDSLGLAVPIVFMSGYTPTDLAERLNSQQNGPARVLRLPKPFKLQQAIAVIEEALRVGSAC